MSSTYTKHYGRAGMNAAAPMYIISQTKFFEQPINMSAKRGARLL